MYDISEIEKSLCRIYFNSYNNQLIDNEKDIYNKLNNFEKQWPYDMKKMCEKYNFLIDG